jgi:archaellum component FlaC
LHVLFKLIVMQTTERPSNLQSIINELEKRYPNFKKMDIYKTVSNDYKNIRSLLKPLTESELQEIKNRASRELSLFE